MNDVMCGRLILATDLGATVDRSTPETSPLPEDIRLYTGKDFGGSLALAEPFETTPVLPETAAYRGQAIGLLLGRDWATLDRVAPLVPQTVVSQEPPTIPDTIDTFETTGDMDTSDTYEIVEGIYQTGLQLHAPDAPLWAEAAPSGKGVQITLPCQWPAHVRASVALALDIPVRAVHMHCRAPSGNRDGAIIVPAIIAVLSSAAALQTGQAVRIALRYDQSFLSGGRSPGRVVWASRLSEEGNLLANTIQVNLNLGAYPVLTGEMTRRLRTATASLYRPVSTEYRAELSTTPDVPMGPFEGVASAQISFAREVHFNRLAEIAGQDPILWRQRHLKKEWPVTEEICSTLAREADFYRRYSANELVKKRRTQLSLDSSILRGIGFAMAQQQSGMTGDDECGTVTIRLNQNGTADLFCSVPTPTLRLHLAWRQLVSQELGIETEAVSLESGYDSNQHDSGPRLFSRGVSLVPRAILQACQAIQKQRFREPLPITVRRAIRAGKATRTPVDALRSIAATGVEAVLHPASMEIDVRSVTMAIYAGRILDRGMAEAELRRGIYHSLNWTLHESLLDAELLSEPETLRSYSTAFRGAVPAIRIVFMNQIRKEGPVGIGELPFNTVPAALVSAISQATGLYLDSLPVRPANILRQLQEE
jgi:CO/xanthine dehydrogenase Mo-binding subunit